MRIRRPEPALAGRQSEWIAAMEPWRGMGYQAKSLARYLRRMARADRVFVAEEKGAVLGILVFQPEFLLGAFVALLAVRPDTAGKGIGRALMARIEKLTFARKRWLYVSSDSDNQPAARFYQKLGFSRAARLPDLILDGRTELFWRKRRD